MADEYVVYILECGDGTFYTGYTSDLDERVTAHRNGDGAKYTRGRGPLTVRHVEHFEDRGAAMSREATLKGLPRHEKEAIIAAGVDSTDF